MIKKGPKLLLLALFRSVEAFIYFITKYYPFSLLFRRRIFHADLLGAERTDRLIRFSCYDNGNRFILKNFGVDSYFYYVYGEFEKSPSKKLFEGIQKLAQADALEITNCGKTELGQYKFIAPVEQNWKRTWI